MPSNPNEEAKLARARLRLVARAIKRDHSKALMRHVAEGMPLDSAILMENFACGSCQSLLEAAALRDSVKCFEALLAAGAPMTWFVIHRVFNGRKSPQLPSGPWNNPGCQVLRSLYASGELDPDSADAGMALAIASGRPEAIFATGEALARKEATAIDADIRPASQIRTRTARLAGRL